MHSRALPFLLFALLLVGTGVGCTSYQAVPVTQESDFSGLTLEGDFASTGVTLTVRNQTGESATILWSQASWVDTNGQAERLVPLGLGDVNAIGEAQDQALPANASITTLAAPASAISQPTPGGPLAISIPIGPEGGRVRIVLSVESGGRTGTLDQTWEFQAR